MKRKITIEIETLEANGKPTCRDSNKRCPFLGVRRYGTINTCLHPALLVEDSDLYEDEDGFLVPHRLCPFHGGVK